MKKIFATVLAAGVIWYFGASEARAWSGSAIDASVDEALAKFKETKGADEVLKKAQGVLVIPKMLKAGIGIGGEYGEGALRINEKTADYYSSAAASIGFQLGAQQKTIIILFMDKNALDKFQSSSGFKIGVDASVAVVAIGTGGTIDSANINQPIIAFVLDQKGLMYNVTLEGAKITKLKK